MNKFYILENHCQLLDLWRQENFRDIKILHLDSHCDLSGLFIDQDRQLAYKISWRKKITDGNFLTFAFLNGIVNNIRWVYDAKSGGRKKDLFTVRYNTDKSAILYRIAQFFKKEPLLPIDFKSIEYKNWDGLKSDEHLDIDWDFFANYNKHQENLLKEINEFLDRDFKIIPQCTYISYSPKYSYPSKAEFEYFIDSLATKFNADIIKFSKIKENKISIYQILRMRLIALLKG